MKITIKYQDAENKARIDAEIKAQSITQQIQDKAKMEAERKSHSITQQAEDKTKAEAERRSKEIIQQAEEKFKVIQVQIAQRQRIKEDSKVFSNKVNTKTIDNNLHDKIKPVDNETYVDKYNIK